MRFVAGFAVVSLIASQAMAGLSITAMTKSEGEGRSGDKPSTMRMKIDGDGARIEWIEGRSPMGAAKGYMVTKDAGKTLYLVDPEKKEYFNAGAMMQMAAGMVSMKVKEYKIEKVKDEAGPTILGYPTRYYKFVTTYSMEVSVFGMKQTSSGKNEQEIWATPKVNVSAMAVFEKFGAQAMGGFGDMQKLIEAEKAKTVKGFPLKTITTSDTGTPGKPKMTKSIMEITDIKEGSVAASEFEIPKDYKETSMPGGLDAAAAEEKGGDDSSKPAGNAPAGLDSILRKFAPKR